MTVIQFVRLHMHPLAGTITQEVRSRSNHAWRKPTSPTENAQVRRMLPTYPGLTNAAVSDIERSPKTGVAGSNPAQGANL